MPKDNSTIVITGGHAVTTAVAVVQELQKRSSQYKIHWIGARSAIEGRKLQGIESMVFPSLGVVLHSITTGRVQKRFTRFTLPALLKIPIGIFQSYMLLRKIKPDLIMSFGGFAAFPVCLSGYLRGIPIVLHEQTIAVGLANKLSSIFATKIAIARESSSQFFDHSRTIVTGNPVMVQVQEIKQKGKKSHVPVVFITCGSRGSQIINNILLELIPKLVEKYKFIHLTGKLDLERFVQLKKELVQGDHYEVYDTISPLNIDSFYKIADIVIARAGANTVSELMIIERPCILIPIPWSRYNEQQKNAESLAQSGLATILHQDKLTVELLTEAIEDTNLQWENIVKKSKPLFRDLDLKASPRVVDIIESLL